MSQVRTFVAVPLPLGMQEMIFDSARGLAPHLPGVKWLRKASNLHVTLGFLGQVAEERLARFALELERTLLALPGFPISVRGFGAFPSARQANVLWAGVDDPSGNLGRAAQAIELLAERLGCSDEGAAGEEHRTRARQGRFHGHVTVGRVPVRREARGGIDVRAAIAPWGEHRFGEIWVNEVHLYESILGGDGSTYVLRGMATLEGATDGDIRQSFRQDLRQD